MKVKPTNSPSCIPSCRSARNDHDNDAEAEFNEQIDEAQQHSSLFRRAARNLSFLAAIAQHHAVRYGVALKALAGKDAKV